MKFKIECYHILLAEVVYLVDDRISLGAPKGEDSWAPRPRIVPVGYSRVRAFGLA
jgi:hypothetical protein